MVIIKKVVLHLETLHAWVLRSVASLVHVSYLYLLPAWVNTVQYILHSVAATWLGRLQPEEVMEVFML